MHLFKIIELSFAHFFNTLFCKNRRFFNISYVCTQDMQPKPLNWGQRGGGSRTQDGAWDKLQEFEKVWGVRYPSAVKTWKDNWSEMTAYFRYPPELRRLIYTTNNIESFNRATKPRRSASGTSAPRHEGRHEEMDNEHAGMEPHCQTNPYTLP